MEKELETKKEDQPVKQPGSSGMSGSATLTLRDAKTGEIKQQITCTNTILARGLDWIVSHIVTGKLYGGNTAENSSTDYHAYTTGGSPTLVVTGSADVNPFKYLMLLQMDSQSANLSPTFSEGTGSSTYKLHRNESVDAAADAMDVYTTNGNIGDSGAYFSTSNHVFDSNDPATRTKILGWKALGWDPVSGTYSSSGLDQSGSKQSNEDSTVSPAYTFRKVYLLFKFAANEANGTINNIVWASSHGGTSGSPVTVHTGARLNVSPSITKTNADTLDITYTFELYQTA